MALWSEFLTNDKRQIHKWTHYFPIYERHFARFRNQSIVFIEIGVQEGGSLQLWKRYFGPFARIVGIDIEPSCKNVEEDQIEVRIGDQSNPEFLKTVIEEFGRPTVVLDDGSHMMAHVSASFDYLYPQLEQNGVYFVEDLHTAYWEEYGGALHSPASFIERAKNMIDDLNADHSRGARPASSFSQTTLSMHFYDSVIVFEKGRHIRKHAPKTGKPGQPA
jgi:hypothetical protein